MLVGIIFLTMSIKYMYPERGLELESLSDALSTAVAVTGSRVRKHVSIFFEGFLKIWNAYAATY